VRRTGRIAVLAAGLAVALAGGYLAADLASLPAPGPSDGPSLAGVARAFTELLDEAQVRAMTRAQWAAIARANAIVVLNSWDYRLIPVLKRANPAVGVWVYKDLSGVRSDDCTTRGGQCGTCPPGVADSRFLSSGVGYCWLRRHHPGWLLRAAGTGGPFRFRGYPATWEADYGNGAYQRQWIRNVLADVRGHGWDGVVVDNALTTANAYGTAARYPTDASVQAATYAALRRVGAALRTAGVGSVANVGYATSFPGLWQRWLGPVGGLEQEFYLSYTTQPGAVGARWSAYQDEVSSCAAQNKVCWFHAGSYSAAVSARTRGYALASLLLATDGRQLLAVGAFAPAPAPLRAALGHPLGAVDRLGQAWRRSFAGGVAVVNPSGARSVARLGRAYLDGTGQPVSTVVLPPATGMILRALTHR
jgi:Hypothetical glycosyl hydrolase family 15